MTTLHDRLAELAEDAPPGGPVPDLWVRGRRYRRRQRVGALGIALTAVVALVAIAGLDWQRSAPEPAPAGGPAGLPDQVWSPSPWLPSAERPGQLVAVTAARQGGWFGDRAAVVGLSATSGAYAFLDLPDADLEHGEVALAPDGSHLAYWLTGRTTDTPSSASGPIVGVAVYDTATGETARHWIPTGHGLNPDFLVWADADTVVFSAGQIRGGDDDPDMDQSSSSFGTVTSWALGGEPRPVRGVDAGASLLGAGHGQILLDTGSSGARRGHPLVDLADPGTADYLHFRGASIRIGTLHFAAVDGSGRVALVPGSRNPHTVHAGPSGSLREIPGTDRTFGVVDWLDADTIVTLRRTGPEIDGRSGLYRVAVATGDSEELVRFPVDTYGGSWQFATDLLGAPSIDGVKPPAPMDPRVTAGLSIGVCLAAAAALVLWRRRVRA